MRTFSEEEWERAQARLALLTTDPALLRAFARLRRSGTIDADLLYRLQGAGVVLGDLFKL